MGLADQAVRMQKRRYRDVQVLADELYLVFLTDVDLKPGPTNITDDNGDNTQIPFELVPDPLTGFILPDLQLPLPDPNPSDLQQESQDEPDPNNPTRRRRKRSIKQMLRVVLPGFITSNSTDIDGTTYGMDLYPNGLDEDAVPVTGVVQMQIDSSEVIPLQTAALCVRLTKYEIIRTEILETGPGGTQGERIVSASSRIRVLWRKHYCQVPIWLSDL